MLCHEATGSSIWPGASSPRFKWQGRKGGGWGKREKKREKKEGKGQRRIAGGGGWTFWGDLYALCYGYGLCCVCLGGRRFRCFMVLRQIGQRPQWGLCFQFITFPVYKSVLISCLMSAPGFRHLHEGFMCVFFPTNIHINKDNKQQIHLLLIICYMCMYICCFVSISNWSSRLVVIWTKHECFSCLKLSIEWDRSFSFFLFNVKHLILLYYCCAQQQSFFPLKNANSAHLLYK